jgi:hypothetical protein
VVAVASALGAIAAGGITVMSCEPDHNRDVPGPPKIISAYVNDLKATYATASAQINGGGCDGTDPRMFGGGFQVHDQTDPNTVFDVRCIPDLLANPPKMDLCGPGCNDTGPFSYATQVRVVFSEGLNGDLIEDQDNVKLVSTFHDGVISATAGSLTVPINTGSLTSGEFTTYYDPAGADFKQGIYGTAPPGPSIVVTPGDNLPDGTPRVFGLPSGSMTQLCFSPDKVKDTVGNGIATGSNCVTVKTAALDASTTPGDSMGSCAMMMCDQVTADDLVGNGIAVQFTAPIPGTMLANAAGAAPWLTITATPKGGTATVVPAACYMVAAVPDPADATLPSADALIAQVTIDPACPLLATLAGLPAAAYPVNITVKTTGTMIQDQYGVQLPGDVTHEFQVKMSTPMPDGGAL